MVHKQVKGERPLLSNTACKVFIKNYNYYSKNGISNVK